MNNDVVLELPQVRMLPQDRDPGGASAWLVDWYQYDQSGQRSRVMGTYYNVTDGWFLETPTAKAWTRSFLWTSPSPAWPWRTR